MTISSQEFRKMQNESMSEDDIHKAVIKWWQARNESDLFTLMHYPSGGKRGAASAGRMKALGQRRGVPDLLLPVWKNDTYGQTWHGLWLELKSASGYVRPEQSWWLKRLRVEGFATDVAYSFDEATETLDDYIGGEWKPMNLESLTQPERP